MLKVAIVVMMMPHMTRVAKIVVAHGLMKAGLAMFEALKYT